MNNVTYYTPWYGFSSLRREIDRLFDEAGRSSDDRPAASWSPRMDTSETDDHYRLCIDVPGMDRSDLDIELHDQTLTIRGERRNEERENGEQMHRYERTFGAFYRSISLPDAGEADDIEASLDNGVLKIQVPKREASKPRRIEIQGADRTRQLTGENRNGDRSAERPSVERTSERVEGNSVH